MSRIDELKKQYKEFALSDIDLMKMVSPDQATKYVELLAKLSKSKYKEIIESHGSEASLRHACISTLVEGGCDYNYLETLETLVLWTLWTRLESIIGSNNFKLFLKFANLNERKLISNNDVTSYKSFDELESAVSLAEMKLIDKELEKQIKKIYEDDEWISLRPLSLEASMKYGANTKWCTTTNTGQYYARYSSRGVLIYNINKKTGYKVACFKNLSPEHDNEFSWWDVTDRRIEALESEAPVAVLEAVRNEIKNHPYYNSHLMSEAEQAKLNQYKEGYGPTVDEGTRLVISGGFATVGTNTTITTAGSGGSITFNPSTYTTNTIGMGTTTPSTQLSISGNVEINDGDLIIRSNGEERMRITAETRENFERTIEEHLERVTERAVEERAQQQSLLDDIELEQLSEDYKRRLQILAGIDPDNEASPESSVEDNTYDPTKDPFNELYQAEQPNVPSEQLISKNDNFVTKVLKKIFNK